MPTARHGLEGLIPMEDKLMGQVPLAFSDVNRSGRHCEALSNPRCPGDQAFNLQTSSADIRSIPMPTRSTTCSFMHATSGGGKDDGSFTKEERP